MPVADGSNNLDPERFRLPSGSSLSHRVERVHYDAHDGPSFLQCTCGTRLDSPTAEGIYKMWTQHRGPAETKGWINTPETYGSARYGGMIHA
jgi:hypothetical protein